MIEWRVFVALLAIGACHRPPPPPPVIEVPAPTVVEEPPWVGTLAAVRAAVDAGRFAAADSILASFERTEAGSADVAESTFWRALLRADPRNPDFTPANARAALEAYLRDEGARHRAEAGAILRLLVIADSLRAAQASQRSAFEQRDRARDAELEKLRDELQRTQAELDRIKRRLAPVKP